MIDEKHAWSLVRRAAAAGCACVLAISVLAGCTADEAEPPDEQVSSPTIEQMPAMAQGSQDILVDVGVVACPTDPGVVTAIGTVTNSADEVRDLALLVKWTAPDGGDPLMQLGFAENDVPPGGSVDWSVSGELLEEARDCVISARSGTLSGG